ncbi:MAG: enoyl-CoA hydratase [Magnetospirillum sp.]|nr:enoyl-CoA hydratase [Magnetospirillum sp.]
MDQHVVVTAEAGICTIRMNRPDKKNALTHAMYAAMAEAVSRAEADPSVRVLVFAGTGDAFTAGNDLNDFLGITDIETTPVAGFLRALSRAAKPVVAAVNGTAIGIGSTMLLHCDLVVAVPEARLQFPFINLALVPEAAASLLLPRLVGHQRAAELLMLGEPFDAVAAHGLGLVNRIVPAEKLAAAVAELAGKLADKPAEALRRTKALLKAEGDSVPARLGAEAQAFTRCLHSPELKEAVAAFFERRPPNFRTL